MEHLVMFILGKVAVSQQRSGFLCIFLSKQTLGQKGSIWGDVVAERLVDSLHQLALKQIVILSLFLNHYSNSQFKLNAFFQITFV